MLYYTLDSEEARDTAGVSSSDDDGTSAKTRIDLPTCKEPSVVEDAEMDKRYFPEDASDTNYHGADPFKLWCESCGHLFGNVLHFACHHRRHQGPMLFTCPSCSEGFPNLQSCLDHEVEKHGKVIQFAGPGTSKRNVKKKSKEGYDTNDGNSSVCVSNSVNLYKGPIVSSLPDCVAVEKLHGVYGRTIYTRLLDWL